MQITVRNLKVTSVRLQQFCGNDMNMLNEKAMKEKFSNITL